jgi:bifunctional DNA-binding transcriptional regulator/antitoxin component of YhaV-PrlF toxin-antitoxin module
MSCGAGAGFIAPPEGLALQTLISDELRQSDKNNMSEEILTVGKKGEIFTSKGLRSKTKIREGGKVRADVIDGRLVIEPIPSLEETLGRPVLVTDAVKAERLSEEAQMEAGVYG